MNPRLIRSRRAFLRTVGAGAVALPFFKLLENSAVEAAEGDVPLRFIGVYHPHGIARELFRRQANETDTEFNLRFENSVLMPFDDPDTYGVSFKDKIITIEGIDLKGAIDGGSGGHGASCSILTGSAAGNSSIDQFLAVEKGLGKDTRVTSLVLGVGNDSTDKGVCISFGTSGTPLPKIIDPAEAFKTVFTGVVVGDDPEAQAAAERARARGKSLIDFIRKDVNRLYPKLAKPEQEKLDQHLTAVRDIEKRLDSVGTPASCAIPSIPDSSKYPKLKEYNGGEVYFDLIHDLQIDILAQALACDITRFATLWMADLSRTGYDPSLPDDVHSGVAHTYAGSKGEADAHVGGPEPGQPSTWLPLGKQNRYSYAKAARLLQKLHEFNVLDSSVVYMSSDMGDPSAHSSVNVPTVLAGGAGGKWRAGRRIVLAPNCPPGQNWCQQQTMIANNQILVSIAQMFGVATDTFGSVGSGGLAELA